MTTKPSSGAPRQARPTCVHIELTLKLSLIITLVRWDNIFLGHVPNGVTELQLGQQYWSHVEMYPLDTSINLPVAYDNLVEHLSFMYIDVATSHTSTSPWTEQQCQLFLSMLHRESHGLR